MGCKQSSTGENDLDGAKRKRRNSGLILIENKISQIEKVIPQSNQNSKEFDTKNETTSATANNLSDESKAFIKRALLRSGVFTDEIDKRNISAADIEKIVESFEPRSYEDGDYIFHQNDFPCDTVFIAKRGIFRGLDGSHCKAVMRSKDIIGELGFFHQNPRMLSIVAGGTNPSVFALNKRDFKAIVEKGRDLKTMKIMEALSEAQKYLVKDRVTIANYIRGDIILKRGTIIPNFYIVLSGQVGITGESPSPSAPPAHSAPPNKSGGSNSEKKGFAFMAPGDYFGEDNFVKGNSMSRRTFVAMNEVTLCVISRELFESAEFFGPVKSWIINDIKVREGEYAVSSMRRKRSYVKFNESGKSETLSQKSVQSLSGMPPGILVTVKRSVSTVDMDENENVSNDSDVDPVAPDFHEIDDTVGYDNADNLSWLFSLRCGLA